MAWTALLLALAATLQDPDEEQIKRWVRQLGADYLEEREEAKKKLAALGKKAEDPLIDSLQESDYRIRRACLELLLAMKSTKAVKTVAELFRNPDEDRTVRQGAFAYLQGAGKAAEDVLIEALSSEERAFRLGAVTTLKEIKSEKCAEKIAELYDREQEKEIKDAAFVCLQSIGKPAQPFLLKLLASADSTVRDGAILGLKNINKESKDPEVLERIGALYVIETDPSVLNNAYLFLKESGDKSVRFFVAGLRSVQDGVRLKSLEGLTELKSDAGIDGAAGLFERDPSDSVRQRAKDYLEIFGTRVEEHFVRALDSENVKVKLLSIQALGKIKSTKPLARISKLFREDKDAVVHRHAFDYLKDLGAPAEDDLIFALDDADRKIKLEAARALGDAKCEKAIPYFIKAVTGLDAEMRKEGIDGLVKIGPKAIAQVEAGRASGEIPKNHADFILGLYYQVEVEKILAELLSDEGGLGYYKGMFEPLRGFGLSRALPVLINIVKDKNYQPKLQALTGNQDKYGRNLRDLAILAIGELGDPNAVEPLEEVLRDQAIGPEDEYNELVVALYKLGATKHLEKFVQVMEREAAAALTGEYKEDGYHRIFTVALVHSRVGGRDAAEKVYRRLVGLIEQHGKQADSDTYFSALYNLACIEAQKGEKKSAVETLRKAVAAGFKDRSWIRKDRDFDPVREEPEFKKLLADEELFKEKKD